MSTKKTSAETLLSDFERAKTLLVILEMQKRKHPEENKFYWQPHALLAPLKDEFEMERAFTILSKETSGNVEAKYENVDLLDQESHRPAGLTHRRIFLRIKDAVQFKKDYKRIFSKKDYLASKHIEKIEIFEGNEEDEKLRIYINKDYANETITPKKHQMNWATLLEVAKNEMTRVERAKDVVDFFNTNSKNMLYTRSGYALTKILENTGNTITSLIEITTISSTALARRKNISSA